MIKLLFELQICWV